MARHPQPARQGARGGGIQAHSLAHCHAHTPTPTRIHKNTRTHAHTHTHAAPQVLASFLKAIGFIIPLMDAEHAFYYTREVMVVLKREFQTPDEEMKTIVLKVGGGEGGCQGGGCVCGGGLMIHACRLALPANPPPPIPQPSRASRPPTHPPPLPPRW